MSKAYVYCIFNREMHAKRMNGICYQIPSVKMPVMFLCHIGKERKSVNPVFFCNFSQSHHTNKLDVKTEARLVFTFECYVSFFVPHCQNQYLEFHHWWHNVDSVGICGRKRNQATCTRFNTQPLFVNQKWNLWCGRWLVRTVRQANKLHSH